MLSSLPSRQSFTTTTNNIYSYIHIPSKDNKPTLLFLHGWPSQIYDWIFQIQHFSAQGYGVLVPDLLGYGATSRPSDVNLYRLRSMSDELAELLDHLRLPRVVGIGQDWGATLLSRLAAHHAGRWAALAFLAVGPPRPGTPFDVVAINAMTKQMNGFEMLGYVPWVGGDPTAQRALETHAESAMSLVFCADAREWDEWFHPLGKMKQFVEEDRRVEVGEWYPPELREKHLELFARTDGYKGATRWYRMWLENLFAQDEAGLEEFQLTQPTLFVVSKEPAQSAEQQVQMLGAWAPNLMTLRVDAGHWVHLESRDETNKGIEELLERI